MKRLAALFLSVLLCLCFAACVSIDEPTKETGDAQSSQTGDEGGSASTEETKNDKFGVNDTAVFKSLKFTATEIKESTGTEFFKPEDGKIFVGINFTIENVSNETQSISSLLQFEGYANDVKSDYSFNAACAFSDGTIDGDVAAGKKLVGWFAMEVPENWSNIEIIVKPDAFSLSSATFSFEK